MDPKVEILSEEILSNNWYTLRKYRYEYTAADGSKTVQTREAYDRGNGAAILLYNKEKRSVILTRQFRLPSFVNGNTGGMLIEACAGLLDKDNPEACIRREAEEETGYQPGEVTKIMEAYMSPGSVTEMLHFFVAPYTAAMKVAEGGGVAHEQESIQVLEVSFDDALLMMKDGRIKDAKTIMLLQYAQINQLL
ncbi:MAG: GDP-mannose pyrophosphatase NudK [Bacteroidota bacterium]|nr:GDP-mannose pyrophosphatase NudK [Bacteroidota bacterium]